MKNWKRYCSLFLTVAMLTSAFAGCAGQEEAKTEQNEAAASDASAKEQAEDSAAGITVTDQAGRVVTLEEPADSLVSAYYISTALLVALGCEDDLVGIEKKADTRELYKLAAPQLLELPAVGSGKGINVEETAALEPDVVIIPLRLEDSVESFEELGIPVVVVNPETQEEFEECVELLAEITGTQETGDKLLGYYHEKMEQTRELTQDLEEKPTVYLSAGSDYLSTCTSKMYQNDLIEMAGGTNVSAELTDGYWQTVSAEQLAAWDPQWMFPVSYAEYSIDDILNDSALSQVQAVTEGNILTFPSEIEPWDYPTPSSVLGVLWLTCILHPDLYTQDAYVEEAKDFYQTFFQIDVTEEQLGL